MLIQVRSKSFEVNSGDHRSFWDELSRGAWESATFEIFERFLDPNHSYIDIGTWIGPTLLFGCQFAKVAYGLEPDPFAYAELKQNLNLNQPMTDNVCMLNACIAPNTGEVAFGSRGQGGDSTSSLLFGKKKTHWTVKAYSFSDFIVQNNVSECNFIKMDIEGGEYSILPTMVEYLKTHRPTLHLSLHPCYLKIRPLGGLGRLIARIGGTLTIIRSTDFYKHMYDHRGRDLTPKRLLWLCRSNISMDVVLTDLEWSAAKA
jgi:FkbM family methyltransferase